MERFIVGIALTTDYNGHHVSILLLLKSHNYRQAIKQEPHFYTITANTRQSLDRRRTAHHPKNEAISTFLYDQLPLRKKTNCMSLLISDNSSTIHFTWIFPTNQICITINLHYRFQVLFLHSSELSESKPSSFLLSFAFNFFIISSSVINSPSLIAIHSFLDHTSESCVLPRNYQLSSILYKWKDSFSFITGFFHTRRHDCDQVCIEWYLILPCLNSHSTSFLYPLNPGDLFGVMERNLQLDQSSSYEIRNSTASVLHYQCFT